MRALDAGHALYAHGHGWVQRDLPIGQQVSCRLAGQLQEGMRRFLPARFGAQQGLVRKRRQTGLCAFL